MTLIRCTKVLTSSALLLLVAPDFSAAQKLNTPYISTAPGTSPVIQVAKEARLFEKHGIDTTVIVISGSVRGIQAIPGGDVVAIAGNLNVLPYDLVSDPSIKRPADLRGKIGGTIERMVARQKGIVQFTVVAEAEKAQAERLGYPTVVDMVSL